MGEAMATPATSDLANYPIASNGKRNWSRTAVHGNTPLPSKDTLPEGKFGLGDLLDLINPLQHIPIVGQAYRAVSGDTLGPPARIFGGLLFGGPAGLMASLGGAMLDASGASERALALIGYGQASDIKEASEGSSGGGLNIKI
jgi:hypothetical protein